MQSHFWKIFWGLVLVGFHISLRGFDILLDGLGYLLIAVGCRGLALKSSHFDVARQLGFALAVLWLVGFAIHGELAIVYGFAMTAVNCGMVWQLLGGVRDFASMRGRSDLARRAETRRTSYVALAVIAYFAGWFGAFALAVVVAVIAVIVMILHLIYRVATEVSDSEDTEASQTTLFPTS